MKLKEKLKAIQLRKSGKSYGEIKKYVKVSKGTISLWLRDIKLTPEQKEQIYKDRCQKNAYRLAKLNQRKRIERTKETIKRAKNEFLQYYRDSLFLSGLMLYWAEGDKSESQEQVKFSNSDPAMIKFIMKWFRKICKVPDKKIRIALHIHTLFCRKNIEQYWSNITKIPLNQFHKTQVKPTSLKHRKNHLYNGTCAVVISSKDLFRKIKGWKIGFIEKMA